MSNAASFSRVQTYKKCPAMYEWQYILGNKDERGPGPAAERGTRIHNSIEQAFLTRNLNLLDVEVPTKIRSILQMCMHDVTSEMCETRPEMVFALTRDWEPTEFEAEDAYVRGFMDGVFVYEDKVLIHEYKTGKEYDEHAEQKQLYAMVAMIMFPEIQEVEVIGVYIDQCKLKPTTYSRAHLNSMKFTWQRQIDKMAIASYPTRPGMHCRWCNKSAKAGGPCPYGK